MILNSVHSIEKMDERTKLNRIEMIESTKIVSMEKGSKTTPIKNIYGIFAITFYTF